ncbi:carbon-nitrogen hydrolase family protein [Rhizobium gallicum]|uniref:carbon-nitrogen hydrolase family protein n=1 Tax=Rhizobium gallicum TaxID=56730 RepID=UPI001EF7D746|nr:carbon-nitrogen hydrolase family protein [Rhizobium gallicum]ULJ75793.1 carbon-nitrogen hydrolase family protein [Rhizobium gallicum]
MRVWSVEWPEGLVPESDAWNRIAARYAASSADILVTNEMPFGFWQPTRRMYSFERAREWVGLHERGLEALVKLPVKAVISSRPKLAGSKLVNEAFALVEGRYEILHQKCLFPAETGWQEQAWFEVGTPGFDVANIAGVTVGVLLCTEVMFSEKARSLGKLGADLIAVPRASGADHGMWRTATRMAAVVSGAYVVSSNRTGQQDAASPRFGGAGIIVDCDGNEFASTSAENPAVWIDIDKSLTAAAKHRYPVYVNDPSGTGC